MRWKFWAKPLVGLLLLFVDETGVERFTRENRAATFSDSPIPKK
jgi:hypothetical protein